MFVFASYADPINDVARKMLTEDVKIHSAKSKVNKAMNVRQKEDLPRSLWEKYDTNVKAEMNGETVLNESVTTQPETLDELSKNTLKSYVSAAKADTTKDRTKGIELAEKKIELLDEDTDYLKQASHYAEKKRTATTGEERSNFDRLELEALRKAGLVDKDNGKEGLMESTWMDDMKKSNPKLAAKRILKTRKLKESTDIRQKVLAKLHESDAPLASFTVGGKKVEVDGKPFTEVMPAKMAPEGDQKAHDASLQKPNHPPTLEESVKRIVEGISAKKMADALKKAGNDPKKIDPNMFNEPKKADAPKMSPEGPIKFDGKLKPVDNFIDAAYKVLKQTSRFTPVMPVTDKDRDQFNKQVKLEETAFGDAFKNARTQGLNQFTFNGKSYGTRLATETNAAWKANMSKAAPTPAPQPAPMPADHAPVVNSQGGSLNNADPKDDNGATLTAVGKAQTLAAKPGVANLTAAPNSSGSPDDRKMTLPTTSTMQDPNKTVASIPKPAADLQAAVNSAATGKAPADLISGTFDKLAGNPISSTNVNQALTSAVAKIQQTASDTKKQSTGLLEEGLTTSNLKQPKDFYKDGGKELNTIFKVLSLPKIDLSGGTSSQASVQHLNEQMQSKPAFKKTGDVLDGFDLEA